MKLLQAHLTGLPEGLAPRSGLAENSPSEFAFAVQALTAEARLLAPPVSYEVVSTMHAEGIEDRITMAPLAARRLAEMVSLSRASRGHRARARLPGDRPARRPPLGEATGRAYRLVRERVSFMDVGDPIPQDLEPVVELVRSGAIA